MPEQWNIRSLVIIEIVLTYIVSVMQFFYIAKKGYVNAVSVLTSLHFLLHSHTQLYYTHYTIVANQLYIIRYMVLNYGSSHNTANVKES